MKEQNVDLLAKIVKDLEVRIMMLECRWGTPPYPSHFIEEKENEQTTRTKSRGKRKTEKAAAKKKRKV